MIWYYLGDMSNLCYLLKSILSTWHFLRIVELVQKTSARGGKRWREVAQTNNLRTTHNTHIDTHHRRTSNHGRRRPPAANSNISDPTTPTLPTSRLLIDYAIGYKEMQQLSTMEGYLQSYGQARFGG